MILRNMARPTLLASAVSLVCALSAGAAMAADGQSDIPKHLRGTITAVSDHGFSVESTSDGKTHDVSISDDTRLAGVTPSSLDAIQEGTFIGTANAPGADGQPSKALEVVVFPESMKGTGEGDYPWDTPRGHDQSGSSGGKMGGSGGGSTMTNGTVSQTDSGKMGGAGGGSTMTNGTVSQADSGKMGGTGGGSTMTNGTVNQSDSGDKGMMTLTVDYGDGKKQIMVPRDVPVVAVQKATMDDIKKGEAVFVAGDLSASPVPAKVVIVGLDGTVPPM
ncbi:metal ABC transporter permease [Kushneria konosiri]|nr:metal ABC transporter permease [Kushneria konosiri]